MGAPLGESKNGRGSCGTISGGYTGFKGYRGSTQEELSPIDAVRRQIQDNKSSLQIANEKFKGENAFKDGDKGPRLPGERLYAEPAFWDLLYDEPCWINPETGSFELQVRLEELHKRVRQNLLKMLTEKVKGAEGEMRTWYSIKKKAYEIFLKNILKVIYKINIPEISISIKL